MTLQDELRRGHRGQPRVAGPAGARIGHAGHRAEPDHRLREGGADRQDGDGHRRRRSTRWRESLGIMTRERDGRAAGAREADAAGAAGSCDARTRAQACLRASAGALHAVIPARRESPRISLVQLTSTLPPQEIFMKKQLLALAVAAAGRRRRLRPGRRHAGQGQGLRRHHHGRARLVGRRCPTRWATASTSATTSRSASASSPTSRRPSARSWTVKYLPVTSQNRIPLVQNGTVDIECGSTTNNATRARRTCPSPLPPSWKKCASR